MKSCIYPFIWCERWSVKIYDAICLNVFTARVSGGVSCCRATRGPEGQFSRSCTRMHHYLGMGTAGSAGGRWPCALWRCERKSRCCLSISQWEVKTATKEDSLSSLCFVCQVDVRYWPKSCIESQKTVLKKGFQESGLTGGSITRVHLLGIAVAFCPQGFDLVQGAFSLFSFCKQRFLCVHRRKLTPAACLRMKHIPRWEIV